jgi:hypothetical protein
MPLARSDSLTQVMMDFAIASTSKPRTIPPGAAAEFKISVKPGSLPFANPVVMSAMNLPAGATYSFNPTKVTPGTSGDNSLLTISVPRKRARSSGLTFPGTESIVLIVLPFISVRRPRRMSRQILVILRLFVSSLALLNGCGGGFFNQPQETYTVTVTGTSGSLTHTTSVTLTIE